jgi:hypothetical protein
MAARMHTRAGGGSCKRIFSIQTLRLRPSHHRWVQRCHHGLARFGKVAGACGRTLFSRGTLVATFSKWVPSRS